MSMLPTHTLHCRCVHLRVLFPPSLSSLSSLSFCISPLAGEYIKNWRPRWFVLRTDGTFHGYKAKPPPGEYKDPLNHFRIEGLLHPLVYCDEKSHCCPLTSAGVHILRNEKVRKYSFLLRCLQWTTFIERTFSTETELDTWVT